MRKCKVKCQKDPICGIFLKRGLFKGIKNDTPMCQTCKYTNTNTQIQHMTKCQKDPTCSIFLKKGLFKGIKNYIPMCQMRKCKVKCQKDPTCGIFLKRRLFKDVFWVSHSCTRSSYPQRLFLHLNNNWEISRFNLMIPETEFLLLLHICFHDVDLAAMLWYESRRMKRRAALASVEEQQSKTLKYSPVKLFKTLPTPFGGEPR